jgi:hypothetical protein
MDVALVTGRGWEHSELTVAIDGYVGTHNRRAVNPGNNGFFLRAVGADANGIGFISAAEAADRSAINLLALVAGSHGVLQDAPTNDSEHSNATNSNGVAIAPDARNLTRQRPIAPEHSAQSL